MPTRYVTTNVRLPAETLKALKRRAVEENKSVSQLIRESVVQYLIGEEVDLSQADYLSIVGLGASDQTDIAAEHDRYLGEAIADEHLH
jgi:predicted DNA-binding protein